MNKEKKIELMEKLLEAVILSPALGNLPGNREEISANIRQTFNEVLKHFVEATRAIKD